MEKKEVKYLLKNIFNDARIEINKIYLFGSRVNNRSHRFSDYDVLVVTKQGISIETKKYLSKTIRRIFARKGADMDILILSSKEFEISRQRTGSVVKQAHIEGLIL